jgi:pyridoxamine 5'-phosphate oxidase
VHGRVLPPGKGAAVAVPGHRVRTYDARMSDTFGHFRREYDDVPLLQAYLPEQPLELLRAWLDAAAGAGVDEPNGMALATCDAGGAPHCRIVLLKGIDARGLTFFTNHDSDKGRQLAANPRAAATFWWPQPRNRQVRVQGPVERASELVADAYFASRPRRAQLCSAASPQSRVVANRAELEQLVDALAARIGDGPVPRPANWGGYVLIAEHVEFWQGRDSRLHDRFRYVRDGSAWRHDRLAP